jgi:DNA-binding CsgD family transcriptional regulator
MAPGQPALRSETTKAMAEMMRLHWSSPSPSFRRMWTMELVPDGDSEAMDALDEMQRVSASGEMAGRILLDRDVMDARPAAESLDVPTLVAHARDDQIVDYSNGIELAALIPGATLLTLDSRNHLLLREPAWDEFVAAVGDFLGADVSASGSSRPVPRLSEREFEVLECVACGSSNQEIAAQLHLSVRTIERHLTNLYAKLGLSGKSARAGAAARLDELRLGPR